ncbi:hypothetical protein GRI41_10010 [Altererythrobacter aquaemixtae]|uniref:Uncharacterized protein n=2 Tax=Pontixanthobacter aquaemixtae TaxID=1958940 RepID=A0A844ZWM6_9SPHN|nr:hypothetical protein [Pontixanthobacter aquaemixtae]
MHHHPDTFYEIEGNLDNHWLFLFGNNYKLLDDPEVSRNVRIIRFLSVTSLLASLLLVIAVAGAE